MDFITPNLLTNFLGNLPIQDIKVSDSHAVLWESLLEKGWTLQRLELAQEDFMTEEGLKVNLVFGKMCKKRNLLKRIPSLFTFGEDKPIPDNFVLLKLPKMYDMTTLEAKQKALEEGDKKMAELQAKKDAIEAQIKEVAKALE